MFTIPSHGSFVSLSQSTAPSEAGRVRFLLSAALLAVAPWAAVSMAAAACLSPPGDVTQDGITDVVDVQCSVLANLWSLQGSTGDAPNCLLNSSMPTVLADHDCNGIINVADTALAVQLAVHLPLSAVLDANGNQCADACEVDSDSDGTFDPQDCAPHDPTVHPGAAEVCNGYDDNCDGEVDPSGVGADGSDSIDASCSNGDACDGIETCGPPPVDLGVFINELLLAPQGVPAAQGQWFELYNSNATPVNIQGWTLSDEAGQIHVIDAGGALFVAPRGYVVLAASKDPTANGGVRTPYAITGFTLAAVGTLAVLDTKLSLVDRVQYAADFPLAAGASLARRDVRLDADAPESWGASTLSQQAGAAATPGGPNRDVQPNACEQGEPLVCQADDQTPCWQAGCSPATGCIVVPTQAPCDDGNACTAADACVAGVCQGGASPNCDDGNPCTADACDAQVGCVHTPQQGACDDADPCTVGDACVQGQCAGGLTNSCGDFGTCVANGAKASCDCADGWAGPACDTCAPGYAWDTLSADCLLATNACGMVFEDTTWTLENSPYRVSCTVMIPEDVTLQIEPGVSVVGAASELFLVHGELKAHGTPETPIYFSGPTSGYFQLEGSPASAHVDVAHARVSGGTWLYRQGHGHLTLRDSVIDGVKSYIYSWYPGQDIIIERNVFKNTGGISVGISGSERRVFIRFNAFVGASKSGFWVQNWACYSGAITEVVHNAFFDLPPGTIALELPVGNTAAAMLAQDNYWGTTDTATISGWIFDKSDHLACAGLIPFLPVATTPHPDVPVP